MQRLAFVLLLVAGLLAPAFLPADEGRSDEQEKARDLNELTGRLNTLASKPDPSEEQLFLHARVSELLGRAREAPAGSYLFDRLESAIDDLLDASRELERVRSADEDEGEEDRESDAQRETARDLEKAYFRVRQGQYFAEQSGDPRAGIYVRLARQLYQQGRSAYDGAGTGEPAGSRTRPARSSAGWKASPRPPSASRISPGCEVLSACAGPSTVCGSRRRSSVSPLSRWPPSPSS